jgi:hypothetical protein
MELVECNDMWNKKQNAEWLSDKGDGSEPID